MKKILGVLAVVAVAMAACTTVSSVYNGARPNHIVKNGDGTTTFEFLFTPGDYDANMAAQRVNEYLNGYAQDNGYSGYDVVSVSGKTVEKTSGAAAALSLIAAGASGYAGSNSQTGDTSKEYIRLLIAVRFK